MRQSVGRFIIVSLLVLPFTNCGEDDSFSSDVSFDGFPNNPIVFLNDTVNGGGDDAVTITGPWYLGGFTIVNKNTRYQLIVPSLLIEYQGFKNGAIIKGENTVDASICTQDDPARTLYAILDAAPDSSTPTAFFGDANCDGVNAGISDRELIFFEDLPDSDSTSYFVTVTLDGFMFDPTSTDDPIKGRVKKIISFTTQ